MITVCHVQNWKFAKPVILVQILALLQANTINTECKYTKNWLLLTFCLQIITSDLLIGTETNLGTLKGALPKTRLKTWWKKSTIEDQLPVVLQSLKICTMITREEFTTTRPIIRKLCTVLNYKFNQWLSCVNQGNLCRYFCCRLWTWPWIWMGLLVSS